MDRRTLFQVLSVLSVARGASGQKAEPPPRVTSEQVDAALKVLGLDFSEEQRKLMLREVSRQLDAYERLRKIEIPNAVSPAFTFLSGKPAPGASRFKPTRRRVPKGAPQGEDLAFSPVYQLADLLRSRRITSLDLTRLYLDRLKQFSPKLNCTITLTEDLALEQAKQADAEIRRGKYRGPLHGVPWGAKDLLATKGIPTTWGAEPFAKQVIEQDATVVTRLREAGAVLVAKLSMGALAMGGLWFGGMTKTPWNTEQTSSGSSAGSAAATAAGLVGFAIGTETLGSIITPSLRCGTVGLRPTFGRVSRHGAMALCWTLDKIGPITRSVEDAALVLNAIYGPDGIDTSVIDRPFHWEPARPLSSLRVGVLAKAFDRFKDKDKAVYDAALGVLSKLGVQMSPVEWDDRPAADIIVALSAEAAAAFDDITRDGRVAELKDQTASAWPNQFRSARLVPAVEYIRAQRARSLMMEKLNAWFEPYDVIVSPPYGMLTTTNFTGHPQAIVRCGFVDGLPRGLSFLSKPFDEGAALRLALAFEQATDHHLRRPPGFGGG